jgi:hypothetical protein
VKRFTSSLLKEVRFVERFVVALATGKTRRFTAVRPSAAAVHFVAAGGVVAYISLK